MIRSQPSAVKSTVVVIGAVVPEAAYAEFNGVAIGAVVGIGIFARLFHFTLRIAIKYEKNKLKTQKFKNNLLPDKALDPLQSMVYLAVMELTFLSSTVIKHV